MKRVIINVSETPPLSDTEWSIFLDRLETVVDAYLDESEYEMKALDDE